MTKEISNISVALAAYEGHNFIEEQLFSILEQTLLPKEIVITDDSFAEKTKNIIEKIAKKSSVPIIYHKNETQLKTAKNFEASLKLCSGDYIFFSDQDDIWKENKLQITMEEMHAQEKLLGKDTPILIHTDLELIDEEGNFLHSSTFKALRLSPPKESQAQRRMLLIQCYAAGCTCLINKKLKELSLPFPDNIIMHDYWVSLLAAYTGKIKTLEEKTMLYRQHNSNVIGAKKLNIFNMASKAMFNFRNNINIFKQKVEQIESLKQRLIDKKINKSNIEFLNESVKVLSKGGAKAVFYVLNNNIMPSWWPRKLSFILLLLLYPFLSKK